MYLKLRTLLSHLRLLLDNIKFAHTVFALPFALMAMFLAAAGATPHVAQPPPAVIVAQPAALPSAVAAFGWARIGGIFALVIVCMVGARSVAMTANRIHDVKIDGRNPRTWGRPMVTGRLGRRAAWIFLIAMAGVFLAGCAGFWIAFGNPWPMLLAGPALAVLCGYPFAKRFTSLSHFWLGVALGLSPIGAWIATSPGTLGVEAAVLAGAVLFWTAGFDIIYACQDVAVDQRDGLFAIPARLGVPAALWISRACHAAAAALLITLGRLDPHLGWFYAIGVALAVGLLVVEQSLVRPGDLSRVNVAFFTVNGVMSVTLAGFAIVDVLR